MPDASFTLRNATLDAIPEILGLWSEMMEEHQALDPRIRLSEGAGAAYRSYLGYHIKNEESRLCVAMGGGEGGEKVAGFCLTTINRNLPMFLPPRYGYLSDLVVRPGMRRRGVGRALVEDARRWLADQRVRTIQLQVYARNDDGTAFWRAMGFSSFYDRMWLDLA